MTGAGGRVGSIKVWREAAHMAASLTLLQITSVERPGDFRLWRHLTDLGISRMSASRQRTNPLPREGLAARSGDYVCRSNSLNERR
jgi:hypothetical protein